MSNASAAHSTAGFSKGMPRKKSIPKQLSFFLQQQNIDTEDESLVQVQLKERMAGQMHAYLQVAYCRMKRRHTPLEREQARDAQIAELLQCFHTADPAQSLLTTHQHDAQHGARHNVHDPRAGLGNDGVGT